jgi:sporulation protein YlmC with PRC-barrel domain
VTGETLASVTRAISGMTVRSRDRGPFARVRDVAIDPASGLVAGLVVCLSDGTTRVLPSPGWRIAVDVLAEPDRLVRPDRAARTLACALWAARDLLGLEVAAEDGAVVGSIRDVLIRPGTREAAYRIGPPFDNLSLARCFALPACEVTGYPRELGRVLVATHVGREISRAFTRPGLARETLTREAVAGRLALTP